MGVAAAKADGRAVVDRMKAMPTDDDCFGPGKIRIDGRALHPVYLLEAKKPSESKQSWDVAKDRHHHPNGGSLASPERRRLPPGQELRDHPPLSSWPGGTKRSPGHLKPHNLLPWSLAG